MRRFGGTLVVVVFALLLLMGVQALVEGPEKAEDASPQPATAAQVCALPEPPREAAAERQAGTRAPRAETLDAEHADVSAPVLQADTNGLPLTDGRSYLRSAGNVFPLSDLPG